MIRLFPAESGQLGRYGYVQGLSGGTVQLNALAQQQLEAAWTLVGLDTVSPSCDEWCDAIRRSVAMVRALARGEEIDVPVRIGLTGVLVEASTSARSEHGFVIRPADARDEELIRMTPLVGGGSYHDLGRQIIIRLCGDVVVEATAKCKIVVGADESVLRTLPPRPEEGQTRLGIERLRLALALSTASGGEPLLREAWRMTVDPIFGHPSVQYARDLSLIFWKPAQLSTPQVEDWVEYANLLDRHATSKMNIGITRALRALEGDSSPNDMLVDSVIVWENLFGTKPDIVYRVCGSLAGLLGTSYGDTEEKYNKYKKLYGLRSKIVHGVEESVGSEDAAEARSIALEALRHLLRHHPDLLRKKSKDRSKQLVPKHINGGDELA